MDGDADENRQLIDASQREEEEDVPSLSIWSAYRDSPTTEKALFIFCMIAAIGTGILIPIMVVTVCKMVEKMSPKYTTQEAVDEIRDVCWTLLMLAGITFACALIWVHGLTYLGKQVSNRYRVRYFKAILNNRIPWFDIGSNQEFTSKFTMHTNMIEEGVGKQAGHWLFQVSVFIAGVFMGYTRGIKLALVTTTILPLMGLAAWTFGNAVAKSSKDSQEAYAKAGAVVEESLGSVKTITALNAQERRLDLYENHLQHAKAANIKSATATGLGLGLMTMMSMIILGTALYIGYLLITHNRHNIVMDRNYQVNDVIAVVMCLFLGTMHLGLAVNMMKNLVSTQQALYQVHGVIDESEALQEQEYPIDTPEKLGDVEGSFEFIDVGFKYPTRPDSPIFENLNLSIPAKQTTAIVGETGSGKSTVVQLIEKFYEPDSGTILFGGKNMVEIEPAVLRSKLALVSQEPVLFATSIYENIKTGNPDATAEQITAVAKKANAHDFIMTLPDGYETNVGGGGSQLSG
eukprot:CAMPEP_0115036952 /NCGR_PEP_ID=MMETSP0216-20121206/42472_1 /TAXON_ID=223996 /ORGANISM="Protocruzia adherens, Strain Boccale" /LENGTH=517 /DNA_ID=CAMNT_0002416965 /DNA_START=174 /DNA_END=1723 /DNA_ORIENTATION=-